MRGNLASVAAVAVNTVETVRRRWAALAAGLRHCSALLRSNLKRQHRRPEHARDSACPRPQGALNWVMEVPHTTEVPLKHWPP